MKISPSLFELPCSQTNINGRKNTIVILPPKLAAVTGDKLCATEAYPRRVSRDLYPQNCQNWT